MTLMDKRNIRRVERLDRWTETSGLPDRPIKAKAKVEPNRAERNENRQTTNDHTAHECVRSQPTLFQRPIFSPQYSLFPK